MLFHAKNSASTREEKEYLYKKSDGSPLLSEKIREICNNLKSLCESTPSTIKMPEEITTSCNNQMSYNDIEEPKTPAVEPNSARYYSPQGTFSNRSSKLQVRDAKCQKYLDGIHFWLSYLSNILCDAAFCCPRVP